jgi:phosphatidylserine decarboxylase
MIWLLKPKSGVTMSYDVLKTLPQYILPKKGLTFLAGCLADVTNVSVKNHLIHAFIKQYQVDMSESLIEEPSNFTCFNDFFTRHLKPDARCVASADIISPVDGCISELGIVQQGQLIQAKGRDYSVQELLACDAKTAMQFEDGLYATLYLAPKDYHRVHMPMDATLLSMTYIPGALFSVQPRTARVIPKLFARNERLAIFFKTAFGPMVMVMVGATIVGAIGVSWHGDIKRARRGFTIDYNNIVLQQGDEMGYFKLGSTVVMLCGQNERLLWDNTLSATHPIRYGQKMSVT